MGKSNSIQVFRIVKKFISVRQQYNPDHLNNLEALHQSPRIELKKIDSIFGKESDLSPILAERRPKRPSKRARSTRKKMTTFSPPS